MITDVKSIKEEPKIVPEKNEVRQSIPKNDFKPQTTEEVDIVIIEVPDLYISKIPFYHNIFISVLTFILLPLLIYKFNNQKEMLYILIASSVSLLLVLINELINHGKKKQAKDLTYNYLSNKNNSILKPLIIIISVGFIATSYFYYDTIRTLLNDDLTRYMLYIGLGLSALLKLLTSFILPGRCKEAKIESNNWVLVIAFIVDLIILVGLPIYLNRTNILIPKVVLPYLVGSLVISYLLIILNNRYLSKYIIK